MFENFRAFVGTHKYNFPRGFSLREMKMSNKTLKYVTQGIALALLIYVTASSVVPILFSSAYAQSAPLFSVTLLAPTGGNSARRQYASIIAGNMISLGIDAKLFYVNFDQLVDRLFAISAPLGSSFDKGGYDIGFIGWGWTGFAPDIRANFQGLSTYFPPAGDNYALYNSSAANNLLNELYSSTDEPTQVSYMHQFLAQVFNDAPYNYVFEGVDPVPISSQFTAWGNSSVYSEVTYPDLQHWSGPSTLVMAEAANIFPSGTLDPAITASSNSFYSLYVYGNIMGGSPLEADPRCGCYIPGIAQSITASPDGMTWTVNLKPGIHFQDGVEVTADDFLFTVYAETNPTLAGVNLGTYSTYLGTKLYFKFLNGTTRLDDNTGPGIPTTYGWWNSTSRYQFQFHMPAPYAFTRQLFLSIPPLPMHIMEKFPFSTWDSDPFSTASGPYTYTWDTSRYGGSGSYTATGPVGAGAYELQSYDFTNNIATLTKFPGYWNATGLQSLGQFTIDTYKVQWISSKDAAIAALKNGQVNLLDYNFGLAKDKATLESIPNVKTIIATELGWQEMGFNLDNPVFGTGTATPAGQSNPANAAAAARDIRKAISHLIPRDLIVSSLLAGAGYPLAGPLGPGWGEWYNPALTPDTYDLNAAASLLQQAGYTVTVAPKPQIQYAGSPMLGSGSVTISGTGPVANMLIMVQQSTDGGNTWTDFAPVLADNNSYYQVAAPAPPAFGTVWYRANFTGIVPTPDLVQSIQNGTITLNMNEYQTIVSNRTDWLNHRILWTPPPGQTVWVNPTSPIAVSSASMDATVVAVPIVIIILAIVGAVVWRSKKKKSSTAK
jgi:ABC-type transport system substrate-binding protein